MGEHPECAWAPVAQCRANWFCGASGDPRIRGRAPDPGAFWGEKLIAKVAENIVSATQESPRGDSISEGVGMYTVIHSFSGRGDGDFPYAGVTLDTAGNLYGTATEGATGFGTVFKMSFVNSGWVFNTLYIFGNQPDGEYPYSGVARDASGALYGTNLLGGRYNAGTVYQLRHSPRIPPSEMSLWTENIIHSFTGGSDGSFPASEPVFDSAGNLYGTTMYGGVDFGTVFKLTPSKGAWPETVLYTFTGKSDGDNPLANVVLDGVGNVYGTTTNAGAYG